MSNFEETNLGKMLTRLKIFYKTHPAQVKIQVGAIFLISTIVCGQAGQSLDLLTSGQAHSSWNPLFLLYYAWIRMFLVTFLINLLANTVILYVRINKEKTLYDKDRNFEISEKGTMGTGGFMQTSDKTKALIMDEVENINGPILGRDPETKLICSPKKSLYINNHKVVCGGSGARKTTTQVLNELFQVIKRNESFIVTDPKGEIYEMLSIMVEKRGYKTKVLNLVNLENSDGIDFLKSCRDKNGKQDKEIEAVQTLAKVIMANTAENITGGFWDDNQRGLLTAAMLYVMYDTTGKTEPTLAGAYEFLLKSNKTEIDSRFENLDNDHPAKAEYLLYAKTDTKVRDSVINGLMMRLQIFQTNAAKRIVSSDEINITLPSKEKCAYFVIMSDQTSTFDFIASLFFSMFFIKEVQYVDSLKKQIRESDGLIPVNLVMDEFPSIGTIPDFGKKLATVRSRKINITIIFQNYGQLMDKYKDNQWETIVANCDTNIYLGGNDSEKTVDYYSKRLGEMTVVTKGKRTQEKLLSLTDNKFHPIYGTSESESSRPVMTKEELLRLPTDKAIVFMKSCRPLEVLKFVYTEHPMAAEIIERNPTIHVPEWRRKLEGYPDLPDSELEHVIEWMEDEGHIREYLDAHEMDRTYCLMDYLYDVYREEYIRLKNALERKTGESFSVKQEQIDNHFAETENGNSGNAEKEDESSLEAEVPVSQEDKPESTTNEPNVGVKQFTGNIPPLKRGNSRGADSGKPIGNVPSQGDRGGQADANMNIPQRVNLNGRKVATQGNGENVDAKNTANPSAIDPTTFLASNASSAGRETGPTSRLQAMKEKEAKRKSRFTPSSKDKFLKDEDENRKRLEEEQKQDAVPPVQEETGAKEERVERQVESEASMPEQTASGEPEPIVSGQTMPEQEQAADESDEKDSVPESAKEDFKQEHPETEVSQSESGSLSDQNVPLADATEPVDEIDDFDDFDSSAAFSLPEATGTESEDELEEDIIVDTFPQDINIIPEFDGPDAFETGTASDATQSETKESSPDLPKMEEEGVEDASEMAAEETVSNTLEISETPKEEIVSGDLETELGEDVTQKSPEPETGHFALQASDTLKESEQALEASEQSSDLDVTLQTEPVTKEPEPLFTDIPTDAPVEKKLSKDDFTVFSDTGEGESDTAPSASTPLRRPADLKKKGIRRKLTNAASKDF